MAVVTDQERWDQIHKKTHLTKTTYSKYAEEKEKLFPRGSLVVDLGGGTGDDALYFLKNGHSVIVLDISEFALNTAQEKAKEAGFSDKLVTRQIDFGLHDFPVKESSVDVVYSRISLHYFDASHTVTLLTKIYKMLKKGGVSYITLKSPKDKEEMDYLQNVATEFEENVYIENGQLRSRFTQVQLEHILKQTGITDFQVAPITEEISDSDGRKSTLYLNEVVLTKV